MNLDRYLAPKAIKMPANFVHLRLHTAYSLAESTLRIKNLVGLIAADHQPAAAITDTNNMFGALEFSQTLAAAGIQPIMGAQLNLCDAEGAGEVVLLADEPTGNLDPDTARDVFHHLSAITRATNTAALVVTHNQQLALNMDGVLTIENGRVVNIG